MVDAPPSEDTKAGYPWLTVIAWQYDGTENNGMPGESLLRTAKLNSKVCL